MRYWKKQPPVHILAKAYFGGGEKQADPTDRDWNDQKLDELMSLFGGAGGEVQVVQGG